MIKRFKMKALTYTNPEQFELIEKPVPVILDPKDAVGKGGQWSRIS